MKGGVLILIWLIFVINEKERNLEWSLIENREYIDPLLFRSLMESLDIKTVFLIIS